MLDLRKLATLRAVAAAGSFSQAADVLSVSQPAVSRQIALLERQVGQALLTRTRKGVAPTEAGRLLLEHTEAALARLARAERELAELAGLARGHVRLGAFFSAMAVLAPQVHAELERQHAGLTLHAAMVDRRTAFDELRAGELDVALVFELSHEPDRRPADVVVETLFQEPMQVVLSRHHRSTSHECIALDDVAEDRWVRARQGSAARLLDYVLAQARLSPDVVHAGHGDEPVEALGLVAAGVGVTLLPQLTVTAAPSTVMSRPLVSRAPVRRIQAAYLSGPRAPRVEALIGVVRQVAETTSRLPNFGVERGNLLGTRF
jgi:DNA-binding transcriptional LysR family regulator